MYLYQVTRWGNDDSPDGADGEDTHYIVVAKSYLEAAALVDEELKQLPHERCAEYCHVVAQLGVAQASADRPFVVLGPCIQYRFHGSVFANFWVRHYLDAGWIHASNHEI